MKKVYMPFRASFAALAFLLFLASCSSTADVFLIANTSREARAQVLADRGVELYNERLVQKDDLQSIGYVRSFFDNALMLDPLNPTAKKYAARTDAFKSERLSSIVAKAKGYQDKKNRSDKDDYEYCAMVEQALSIDGSNREAAAMRKETTVIKKKQLDKRLPVLKTLETKLLGSKLRAEAGKLASQAAKLIAEILYIDPPNTEARRVRGKIAELAKSWVAEDLKKVKAALDKYDYAGAEATVKAAERALVDGDMEITPELRDAKYRVYYRWAQALFNAKKYAEADQKAAQAMAVNRTAEAADLRSKAQERMAKRDFDAEIEDVVAEIDALVKQGNLAGAMRSIDLAVENLVKQANKDRVAAKRGVVLEKVRAIYEKAVENYNAELYKEARDGFAAVMAVAPEYEQAKAYYGKADAKIKALGGQ